MTTATKRGRGPAGMDVRTEHQILVRVDRAVRVGERELRYQLDRKDQHPLADEPGLLGVLAELEDRGLVESERCFWLTAEGRARLAALARSEGWSS